jgi:hypothetical protein
MDLSASMSSVDRQLMFQGIFDSFHHPEVQMSLDSGNHVALTFIAYGSTSHATETYIIDEVSEGLMAAQDAIWNPENDTAIARINVGHTTTMMSGLTLIEDIITNDDIDAHNTSVILIGDAAPTDATLSTSQILTMTYNLRITFYAAPIIIDYVSDSSIAFYSRAVTPENHISYFDAYGFEEYLRGGIIIPANTSGNITDVTAEALRLIPG